MTKKRFFSLILLLLFLVPNISLGTLDFKIEIDIKESFSIGGIISFNYSIISDEDATVKYIPTVVCPKGPAGFLSVKSIGLQKDVLYSNNYQFIKVDESVEPQTCTAYLEILEPFSQRVEKQFEIKTKPSFDIQIFSCKDESCAEKSKVFVKGEKAYLDYDSEVPEPAVTGKLTAPDNSTKELTLPANVSLDQIGKYILKTEAKKEGYKDDVQTLELVVLEEEPKVINKRICNANKICEPERGENYQNCPQDCPLPVLKPSRSPFFWFVVVLGVITGILIGSIIYFLLKKIKRI